ncbi:transcription/translation regulatory transformer protein RfaH [Idiomarina sp.]|uniref:transcription/translation regulatory transformer protein RfaH n=1 Tax=Idiomarina sp. TaxID=1874361 RepID=UPI002E9DB161|nr:transcription/translation regulatory transformer protein RfaH [Pseudomonadota bacterium]
MDTQTFGGWYVLKTKPRQEDRALENLNRQGFKCFGPKLNVERIVRGKRSLRTEPLFPGYVFVQSDELAEQFYKLRSTYGVHSLVRFGDRIPKLPQSWIDTFKGKDALAETQAPKIGDQVEINEGPFKGFMAKVIGLDGESRCFVLLEWMQKEVKASLSYNELQLH